jgi:hypothetical protein
MEMLGDGAEGVSGPARRPRRRLDVGIMEQHDATTSDTRAHSTGDSRRIRLIPFPTPGGPQDEAETVAPGLDHGRSRGLAEGWAEPARADTDLLQSFDRPVQVRSHPPRGTGEMMRMAMSMGLDLVPTMMDLAYELWMPCHLLTQTEEGCGQGELIEAVEHPGSGAGVRAVVEGQGDPVSTAPAPATKVERQGV